MAIQFATKPGGPAYMLNGGSDQARGLVFWAPLGMAGGSWDPIQGLFVPTFGGAAPTITPNGIGMACTANNTGLRVTSPTSLNNKLPVSLMVVFWQNATPTANAVWFGVHYTSTDTSPFQQYSINCDATPTNLRFQYNNAGSAVTITGSGLPATGALHVLIGSLQSGNQKLYLDGAQNGTGSNAVTSVSSTGSPAMGIGANTSDITTRNPGAIILDARIYDRPLSAQDAIDYTLAWDELYLRDSPIRARRNAVAAGGSAVPMCWAQYRARRVA